MTEICSICNQRVSLNLRQHILQTHKGCGKRLLDRTECCGEMFENCFWLCSQCLADHEINYSNFCITWNTITDSSIIVRSAKRLRSPHPERKYLSFGYRVSVIEFRLPSFSYRVLVTEFRLLSFGYRVSVTEFRLLSFSYRVSVNEFRLMRFS